MKTAFAEGTSAPKDTDILKAIETRLVKMARYFSRVSGMDADDLQQEGWLAVLEILPRLDRTIGSPEQHLLLRARWRMLDTIRVHHRMITVEFAEENLPPSTLPNISFDMVALMEMLTPLQRRILRTLLEGYTAREVAERVGCTPANVAYHVRRIRQAYLALQAED